LPGACLDHEPVICASLHSWMTDTHHAQPLVEMGSLELFAQNGFKLDSPDLCLYWHGLIVFSYLDFLLTDVKNPFMCLLAVTCFH
jgi:hypothetical protein